MSRRKGKVGELEVAQVMRDHGFQARRTAPMQAQQGAPEADVALSVEGMFVEVKRCERVEIDKWCAQAELASPHSSTPCVVWRRSRQPWRVALPLDEFLLLLRRASL